MDISISIYSLPLIAFEVFFLISIALLIKRVLRPTIISFPYEDPKNANQTKNVGDKKCTVVLAGSYNPPHYGHLAMLAYLSKKYGKVIAVIGMNPNKKYDVSPQERANLLREMIQVYDDGDENSQMKKNVQVEVISYYIWRFAMKEKCKIMFRGIRSWSKDGKEELNLLALNTFGPIIYGPLRWPLPTAFLEGNPKYNHISSTLIRQMCKAATDEKKEDGKPAMSTLVPAELCDRIIDAYSKD